MQTNQFRSHLAQPLSWGSYTLGHYPLSVITPRPGIREGGAAPTPQSPQKWFQLTSPKLAYSASPVPSLENHNKGSGPCFPLTSLCLLTNPSSSQWDPKLCGVPPPLGNCNKLSFQWQSSPDLLTSPYTNNNKTYIFKYSPMSNFCCK